jgi:hypothetical protein
MEMSYTRGQSQFGRGNVWAALRQVADGQGAINPSDLAGAGPAQVVKATYDFATDGGAVATITPRNTVIIPAGAIIYGGLIDVPVAAVGPGASIAIGLGSGAQVAALKGATGVATYTLGAVIALVPVWTAASAVKAAAETAITFTISGAVLTAGRISVQIYYHMAGE